ncbi:MAG: hypothetical protein IJZ00_12170 [Lachnospiraceae bacterium]|nr:hypothetical protein [Lachnospiraceae bacterium]MBQ8263026.1 hypothetical protein [Lachnospiraceae bacterium]
MNQYFIIGIVLFFIVLSIICQIMIGVLYQNMINETDNMTTTDHPLLKQCKTRFINCYRLNGGVANVQIFTEKFINRLRFGKISLSTLYHMSGQMILLAVLIAGIGIYLGITAGNGIISLLPYYIVSLAGLYLYFSASSAIDINGKKKILKTNLVDYFENHMINRLEILPESQRRVEETHGAAQPYRTDKAYDATETNKADIAYDAAETNKTEKTIHKDATKESMKKAEQWEEREDQAQTLRKKVKNEKKACISESTQQELETLLRELLT